MRTPQEHETSLAVVQLMKGVVYREQHEQVWAGLGRHLGPVRDHFSVAGLEVVVDEGEGYAYLRSQEPDEEHPLPRLVNRRALSYNVSLLLVLLRKRMVEFEASSSDSRLILTRDQIQDLIAVFLPTTTNEARILDQLDTTIKKVTELGFLRPLRGQADTWEVRRILKAYVDAQILAEYDAKLASYQQSLTGGDE